ncbi:TetR family transcriptional regulator [Sphingomonas metalli]|uniref:TetR family transcriptional regulator n=1 Tax=Sphingomonas metalli TaxID=1779358 RepID=A0A916WS64_9SPHN|nr:TetR/AcrR family transcriptional regulator [Sphingomonas metalli]GGB29571.1 TetR family transcriptional regulator [Sphingomonas metalli]
MNLLQCGKPCRATRATERRQHLLNTARTLFTDRGFHQTGMAQIAAASGVKVGQIYRDFASKEDIIAAIVQRDLEEYLDAGALAAAIASGDRRAIRAWLVRLIEPCDPIEDCCLMVEIHAEVTRNPRIAEINRCVDAQVRARIGEALGALVPGLRDPRHLELLIDLVGVFSLGVLYRRISDPAHDARALADQLIRILDRELESVMCCSGVPAGAIRGSRLEAAAAG